MKIISRNVTGTQLGGGTYRVRFWEISQLGLLIALFFCAFAACKKPQNNPVYLNTDFKSHFNYKPGTYWVMYDSVSGHTDSIYVDNSINYPPFGSSGLNTEQQFIVITHKDITIDSIIFFWKLSLTAPGLLEYQISLPSTYSSDYPIFSTFPIKTNNNCILFQTYLDAGNAYTNIYKVSIEDNSNLEQMIFFISLEKGFITVNLVDIFHSYFSPRSLHLLRYNVVI